MSDPMAQDQPHLNMNVVNIRDNVRYLRTDGTDATSQDVREFVPTPPFAFLINADSHTLQLSVKNNLPLISMGVKQKHTINYYYNLFYFQCLTYINVSKCTYNVQILKLLGIFFFIKQYDIIFDGKSSITQKATATTERSINPFLYVAK